MGKLIRRIVLENNSNERVIFSELHTSMKMMRFS